MNDAELAMIMTMAQNAAQTLNQGAPLVPAPAAAAPPTPQICVRQAITECRPFVPPGSPPRYGGALLAAVQNGGSAAVNNTGLRIGIDTALAEFPPEIRAYLVANNGNFPQAGTHLIGRECIEALANSFARRIVRPILMDKLETLQGSKCLPETLDAILRGLGDKTYI